MAEPRNVFIYLFYLFKYKENTFIRGFKPSLFSFIQINQRFKELKCFGLKNFDQHFKVLSVEKQKIQGDLGQDFFTSVTSRLARLLYSFDVLSVNSSRHSSFVNLIVDVTEVFAKIGKALYVKHRL